MLLEAQQHQLPHCIYTHPGKQSIYDFQILLLFCSDLIYHQLVISQRHFGSGMSLLHLLHKLSEFCSLVSNFLWEILCYVDIAAWQKLCFPVERKTFSLYSLFFGHRNSKNLWTTFKLTTYIYYFLWLNTHMCIIQTDQAF